MYREIAVLLAVDVAVYLYIHPQSHVTASLATVVTDVSRCMMVFLLI